MLKSRRLFSRGTRWKTQCMRSLLLDPRGKPASSGGQTLIHSKMNPQSNNLLLLFIKLENKENIFYYRGKDQPELEPEIFACSVRYFLQERSDGKQTRKFVKIF